MYNKVLFIARINQNNMKQTAVEWLLENLISEPHFEKDFNYNSICWDKAKAMEKEQIIEAYKYGNQSDVYYKPEQYYNETYESKTNL